VDNKIGGLFKALYWKTQVLPLTSDQRFLTAIKGWQILEVADVKLGETYVVRYSKVLKELHTLSIL
jgi:hypothetical protein